MSSFKWEWRCGRFLKQRKCYKIHSVKKKKKRKKKKKNSFSKASVDSRLADFQHVFSPPSAYHFVPRDYGDKVLKMDDWVDWVKNSPLLANMMHLITFNTVFACSFTVLSARLWFHPPSRRWLQLQAGRDAETRTGRVGCGLAGRAVFEHSGNHRSEQSPWSFPRPG